MGFEQKLADAPSAADLAAVDEEHAPPVVARKGPADLADDPVTANTSRIRRTRDAVTARILGPVTLISMVLETALPAGGLPIPKAFRYRSPATAPV